MNKLWVCDGCGIPIATEKDGILTIKHRGRTIKIFGSVVVTCEKCQHETKIEVTSVAEKSVC